MSVSFDVYEVGQSGKRVLVHTTQSAREAREVRDASPGEILVVGRDDTLNEQRRRSYNASLRRWRPANVRGR